LAGASIALAFALTFAQAVVSSPVLQAAITLTLTAQGARTSRS
jgi:hypothetical protein